MTGVVEKTYSHGKFERIELRLNNYGLAQALIKAGLIPEGYSVEYASFSEDEFHALEVTLHKESPEGQRVAVELVP